MTHFGILCLSATGHINTMFPLGRELQQRGHRVTVLSAVEARDRAEAARFEFYEVYHHRSITEKAIQLQQKPNRLTNIQQTMRYFSYIAETRLRTTPDVIRSQGIEVLLVDLSVFEGGTIADFLSIPYITVCCLLPFYRDVSIPPIFTTWQYSTQWWAKLRNRAAYKLSDRLKKPIWQVINRYRQQWHLSDYGDDNDLFSSLAIITRHIPELEFPRKLPPHFHFTGPFHQAMVRQTVDFPFERLNDKPLIYASMGTLQNRDRSIFYKIAAACAALEVQLVLSLGGGLKPEDLLALEGDPIVVRYAPQLELLERAKLIITHAGLNTALEALSCGVPVVAIPITDDQPAVGARIVWSGAGELLTPSQLSATRLREKIHQVLTEPSYKVNAVQLQDAIATTNGVKRAGDIVEQAVLTQRAVTTL